MSFTIPTDPAEAKYIEPIQDYGNITKSDVKAINSLFTHYGFYSKINSRGDREFEFSCCGSAKIVTGANAKEKTLLLKMHNDKGKCPCCGEYITIKNKGIAKTRTSLYEEQRVVIFRKVSKTQIRALGIAAVKSYSYTCRPRATGYLESMYIFKPNRAVSHKNSYYSGGWYETKNHCEPFPIKSGYLFWTQQPDNSYNLINFNCVNDSFLKYNQLAKYGFHRFTQRGDIYNADFRAMKYLCKFCEYPQMEILQKLGYGYYVGCLVENNTKNTKICNWKATNIADFFKMSGQEFKNFHNLRNINSGYEKLLMSRYYCIRYLKDSSIETAKYYVEKIGSADTMGDFLKTACGKGMYKLPARAALNYLIKQSKNEASVCGTSLMYADYVSMAKDMDYPLGQEQVAFPPKLRVMHDRTASAHNAVEAEIKARKYKKTEAQAKEILLKFKKQYEFNGEKFCIIVPETAAAIIKEGADMKHCVAGYAERHLKGVLTILFLRRSDSPNTCLYTIEMHGKEMWQVQGYNNRTPLTKDAKKFFDTWLNWVKAGSRRDKKQMPILKKAN